MHRIGLLPEDHDAEAARLAQERFGDMLGSATALPLKLIVASTSSAAWPDLARRFGFKWEALRST